MTAPTLAIRAARVDDHPLLASVLVEAFETDPLAIWLYPDPVERRHNHRDLFAQALAERGNDSHIDMSPACDAVSIWRTADGRPDSRPPAGARREAGEFFDRIANAAPGSPYSNLMFLGATVRGAGLGSALMRHRLARLSGGVALWTANESNLKFYQRFGFKVANRVDGPGISAWWLKLCSY
jgi:GNAT superfamily N-acetyltransferase